MSDVLPPSPIDAPFGNYLWADWYEKVRRLVNDATNTIPATQGGTGITSYAVGDLLYAATTTTLAKRTVGTSAQILGVVSGLPSWVTRFGVTTLVDGATVTLDASLTTSYRWVIGGNNTLLNPTNPVNGKTIYVRIVQDATGTRLITWDSKYKFSGGTPALSVAPNAKDLLVCQYDSVEDTWFCQLTKAYA